MPIGAMGYVAIASAAATSAATIYASNKASDAAKTAASQQTDAAAKGVDLQYQASKEALDFQKQQWAATQSALEPYVKAGQGAVSKLSGLLGIAGVSPNNWSAASAAPSTLSNLNGTGASGTTLADANATTLSTQRAQDRADKSVYDWNIENYFTDDGEMAVPNRAGQSIVVGQDEPGYDASQRGTATLSRADRQAARAKRSGTTTPAGTTTGSTVKMRAPDGSLEDVPAEYVEYYKGLGAEVVS